jgi:hypothetical protein
MKRIRSWWWWRMNRIRSWWWWRSHGVRVSHLMINGVDIQVTTFRDPEMDELRASRPAPVYDEFEPEQVFPN